MDRWTEEQMELWTDEMIDMEGWMDIWTVGMDRCTDGQWTDGQMDRWTKERWTDGWMDR